MTTILPPEYAILISLGLVLVSWYYITTIFSRRFSQRIYRWLKRDLAALGDPNSAQSNWINGSIRAGGRISLPRPHAPFQQLELMYVLESRGLMPHWLVTMWRGQRDLLVLRGSLRQQPSAELEILPADNQALQTMRQETANPWTLSDGPHRLVIAQRGASARLLDRLLPFLEKYGAGLKRLSWGPKEPHLLIALHLSSLTHEEAAAFFQAVRKVWAGKAG